ncbi:hypothetical protein K413DRAFT_0789 [Clostridium sp. ASBs410]|nr:hypothetical protein K413DRAFT_0789 [Clostridium sp. ASBs410]
MEYQILENIVNCRLDRFIAQYKDSSRLFENSDVRNNLIHPGEYGIYKENLLRNLLRFVLPRKYETGTGFIYNTQKEITGQCDIIIFDHYNTPLMEMDEKERFFPQECVLAVGEVKSILSENDLKKALISLAKKKKIRSKFKAMKNSGGQEVVIDVEQNEIQGIFSFLLCDKININIENWSNILMNVYSNEGIEPWYKHNVIVSLSDGIFMYKTNEFIDALNPDSKKELLWAHPTCGAWELEQLGFVPNEVGHRYEKEMAILKQFIKVLNNDLSLKDSYYPEPTLYF